MFKNHQLIRMLLEDKHQDNVDIVIANEYYRDKNIPISGTLLQIMAELGIVIPRRWPFMLSTQLFELVLDLLYVANDNSHLFQTKKEKFSNEKLIEGSKA